MNDNPLSLLDNIRISNGDQELRNFFRSQFKSDCVSATEMLNDKNLHFSTLYVLKDDLPKKTIEKELIPTYRRALLLSDLLSGKYYGKQRYIPGVIEKKLRSKKDDYLSTLRWIVGTGGPEDNLGSKYEQIIERAAALLIKSYGDTTQLQALSEIIFARNRRKALIHELVWAFFEACSPDSLKLLALRLNSSDVRDAQLAKKLLSFIPGISGNPLNSRLSPYSTVSDWLDENRPFLCYTGESLHLSNMPMPYSVSLSAKYLCHPVSIHTGKPLMRYLPDEDKKLSIFEKLPEERQRQLAAFSWLLYRRNIYQWNKWIRLPVNEQYALASQMTEGYI